MVVSQSTCQMKMESESDHMSSKPQQNLRKKIMESTVLDSFTKITENTERDRVKGAIILLKHINQNQDLENKDKELKYTLERLIRGLGSSRINAQKGFYAALVTLLNTTPAVKAQEIIETIKKQLQTTGNDSKSEKADVYFGQILVCGATIRSGAFFKYSLEEQQYFVQSLLSAGKQRNYLLIGAYTFLYEIIEKTDCDQFKKLWPSIDTEVGKPWPEQSMETILFLLLAKDKFPKVINNKYLKEHLGSPDIITEDTIKPLCDLLVGVPKSYSRHPIYKRICTDLSSSKHVKQWSLELDSQLLKPTRSKLVTALNMIVLLLPDIESSDIPELLTPNLLQSAIKHMQLCKKRKDDEQVKDINNMFKILINRLKQENTEDNIKILVLQKILTYPGNFMFEKITGIKMIHQVVTTMKAEGVEKFAEFYRKIISAEELKTLKDDLTVPWLIAERIQAARSLNRLLSHPTMNNNSKWQLEQILYLFQLSFVADPENKQNIGSRLASSLKECFQHALDLKFSKLDDLCNLLTSVVDYIKDILSQPNGNEKFRTPLSDESIESWNKVIQIITKVRANTNKKFLQAKPVFHILLLHMGLQLFFDDKLARTCIEELSSCYDRIKSQNLSQMSDTESTNEPLWIEVLVDLFLNLLSHNSHWMRSIIRCVFPHLCPVLNGTAIQQILNVLDPEQTQNPLLDNQSDEDTDDNASDNENSESEDENGSNASNVSSEEDSDMDVDSEDEKETVTDKLRMAVQQALGTSGNQTDNESVDLDEISDNEGERLNTALSAAFRIVKENKNVKSKKQSKTDETLTHFRIRVLDLIDIYFDSQPPAMSVLEIILPLFKLLEFAIRDAHQNPLEMRIRSTFNRINNLKKMDNLDEVKEEILYDFMKSLLDKGTKSSWIFQNMSNEITISCLFIIRCSQRSNDSEKIVEIMKDALESFFEKRDCVLPYVLFKNCFEIIWDGIWLLVPLLINFAFDAKIRAFRRTQALELLISFYKNHRFLTQNVETLQAKLIPIEVKLNENSLSVFNNDTEDHSKGKFVGCLISLLHTIEKVHNQFEIKSDSLDYEAIKNALLKFKNNVSFSNDAKKAFNKFVGGFKSQTQLNESENTTPSKKSKKRKLKNKQAQKKSKRPRVEVASEGTESLTINGENLQTDKEADISTENIQTKAESPVKKQAQKKSKKQRVKATSQGTESLTNGENLQTDEEADISTENVQAEAESPVKQETENSDDVNNSTSNSDSEENSSKLETNKANNSFKKQNDKPNFKGSNRQGKPNGFNKQQNSPNKRQNFNGPNRRQNFNGPNGRKSFDGPNRNQNFDGPNRRQSFDGPNRRQNFNGPNGRPNFGGPNGRPNFGGSNGRPDFNGPNRRPNFDGPNKSPNGMSNFSGPNRSPNFGGPNRNPNFGGPNRRPNFDGPNRRPNFDGPNGRPNFNGPNGRPNFNGPNRSPNFGGPNRRPNFNGPNRSPNFNGPNRKQNFDGPNGRQNGFNKKQNFNGKRKNEENDNMNSKKIRT